MRVRGSSLFSSSEATVLLRQVSMGRRNLVSRSCFDFSVSLDRQRRPGLQREQSYSHFRRTHTPYVSLVFSWYPSHPVWSLHGSSHTPCVGSLFSRYLSHPVWSLRGSSHTPCVGSLFSRYLSRPAWSFGGSSHMPYVGSLFSWYCHARRGLFAGLLTRLACTCCSRGVVVAVLVTGIER